MVRGFGYELHRVAMAVIAWYPLKRERASTCLSFMWCNSKTGESILPAVMAGLIMDDEPIT